MCAPLAGVLTCLLTCVAASPALCVTCAPRATVRAVTCLSPSPENPRALCPGAAGVGVGSAVNKLNSEV
eukprot:1423509-Rhodomonas_salina.6